MMQPNSQKSYSLKSDSQKSDKIARSRSALVQMVYFSLRISDFKSQIFA